MSRIFAIVSKNNEVSNKIFEGLKKLDFYPYDSVGIATFNGNSIHIKKNKGKIEEIFSEEDLKNLSGKIGVGHLRWATHGAPAEFNSHPLTDCYNNIAVVQNGVIGNFLQLKDELIQSNHKFVSKTDTEVIAHHLEKISGYNINYFNQITEVLKKLEGCFSLVIISKNLKNYLIAFSKGLPLYIGLGKEENYVSSEPAGFIKQTYKFLKLEEDEIALVGGDSYKIFSINGLLELNKEAVESTWE
jgi:Glucosamine 6-phosphate synthetase, contains amidotransferase and phosphosugar isomerase domains